MIVREVMSTPAFSLRSGTRLEAAIRLLAARQVSSVPIVDEHDRVLGIVSEADLLGQRIPSDPRAHLRPIPEPDRPWSELVDDVMTANPTTVQEGSDLGWVSDLFARTRWKSLPVVRGPVLVGMISRSDVIQALTTPDVDVQQRVAREFAQIGRDDWIVEVVDGVVTLRGLQPGRETRLATAIAETAPGVRRVVVAADPR